VLSCGVVTPFAGVDLLVAELRAAPRPLRLAPAVQAYDWGGFDFIPALLGTPNFNRTPHAEMWIGAHPAASSQVVAPVGGIRLADLLARAPDVVVGEEVSARFGGTLPFLLKVLDVRSMLSIQAHPDAGQAAAGFEREERTGVLRDAPARNYRDASHKPEAGVALTDVWLLHGFRTPSAIAEALRQAPELVPLLPELTGPAPAEDVERWSGRLRAAFGRVMAAPQEQIDGILGPLVARMRAAADAGRLDRSDPGFWAARAAGQFARPGGPLDRGIVSIFLLNLVHLEPGQGIFIPAGVLHAYLEGVLVEAMAASDNVLRGGLTRKHVDAGELLRVLRFEGVGPGVMASERLSPFERVYRAPAAEFGLSRIDLVAGSALALGPVSGADALLVVEGSAVLHGADDPMELTRGAAVLAPNRLRYGLSTSTGAVIFRAFVPPALTR
jgi:mannose-6-phosphate isomerase